MWQFNLVVTLAADGRYQDLLMELSTYGEFHKTGFLGVILGQVADPIAFLDTVRDKREHQLIAFQDLGRIVPLHRCFSFTADTFQAQIREALAPYVDILVGQSFYVRLERRGFKGRIISPEVERLFDTFLLKLIEKSGGRASIDFDDPDIVLAIETIGERCGIGVLTREQRERYAFVRVP